ncbi:MAG: CoA transferase [Candidatus Eremiobacteraeota bacterium]|nr:CoA transferase [Candidatus Eremiobacteraeota bacterium]MBV8354311.1 CoA transferase [Candidatus Eremiobacteraeota bacterium]
MGPFSGIRVLDLSRILAGPYLTMMLGDLGADVVKVEEPLKGDDTRRWGPPFVGEDAAYYLAINRSKRSIAVDLRSGEGREVILALARTADVVVENFRAGVIERLGLGYETLRSQNPKLVMLRISGFGEAGPLQGAAAMDLIAQAYGGVMSLTGVEDGPPLKAGFAVADLTAGLFGFGAIAAALYARERTGEGQYLTTSLFECQLALHINWAQSFFLDGAVPHAMGSQHPALAPYQAFEASDGSFVLAVGNESLWKKFCDALDFRDLFADARFASMALRNTNRAALEAALTPRFAAQRRAHWIAALESAGVPVAPVLDLAEIYEHPQVGALGAVQTVHHPIGGALKQVRYPVHFARQPAAMSAAPPLRGQHTREILEELGYAKSRIDELGEKGVVELSTSSP